MLINLPFDVSGLMFEKNDQAVEAAQEELSSCRALFKEGQNPGAFFLQIFWN